MENRLLPVIESVARSIGNATIEYVPDNNIIISVPGKAGIPPVALTAHLDKINHFGDPREEKLPIAVRGNKLIGQLDDSAGVGICLSLIRKSARADFPRILVLLSEMEECGGYEDSDDSELFHGIGACRISQYLMDTQRTPGMFVTIDTSPQFGGERGVALYTRFWDKCSLMPGDRLVAKSEAIARYLTGKFPFLTHTNGSNDYINYGMLFNANTDEPVPSLAIEPAIYPCHKPGEEIFVSDIKNTVRVASALLTAYAKKSIQGLD